MADHAAPVTIDEDDIASLLSQGTSPYDGTGDGSGTEAPLGAAIASGSLSGLVDFGADGPAAGGGFGFTGTAATDLTTIGLSSKGVELSWVVQGNMLVGFVDSNGNGNYNVLGDRTVMTVTLNASSGAFVVRQFDQLDHVAPTAGRRTRTRRCRRISAPRQRGGHRPRFGAAGDGRRRRHGQADRQGDGHGGRRRAAGVHHRDRRLGRA